MKRPLLSMNLDASVPPEVRRAAIDALREFDRKPFTTRRIVGFAERPRSWRKRVKTWFRALGKPRGIVYRDGKPIAEVAFVDGRVLVLSGWIRAGDLVFPKQPKRKASRAWAIVTSAWREIAAVVRS